MIDFLSGWVPPPEIESPDVVWELLKYEIRRFVSEYTYKIYSVEKQHIKALNRELEELYSRADGSSTDFSTEINSIRRELREIEEAKARRMIFRSKCNWTLFGERPTKYFFKFGETEK